MRDMPAAHHSACDKDDHFFDCEASKQNLADVHETKNSCLSVQLSTDLVLVKRQVISAWLSYMRRLAAQTSN